MNRDSQIFEHQSPIRVVVVDDQAVIRDGLSLLLSAADDVEVVGQADNGRSAVEMVDGLQPQVVLMDLRMPEMDGAEATTRIMQSGTTVRVLVLTTFADDDAIMPALRAGASGYLTKDATSEALVEAIRNVAAGNTVLDPAVQQRLVQMVIGHQPTAAPTTAAPSTFVDPADSSPPGSDAGEPGGLTRREVDVVRLIAQGLNNRQVARQMVVSEATVKTHINHILAKLNMDDRASLIAWAWRQGLGDTSA